MTASSPFAPPRRNAYLKHHQHRDPRSLHPRLQRDQQKSLVIRNKGVFAVGFLCLVIQFWPSAANSKTDAIRNHHRRGVAVLNTLRRQLFSLPTSLRSLFSPVLVWIEQKLDCFVRQILAAAPSPQAPLCLPAPCSTSQLQQKQQQQQASPEPLYITDAVTSSSLNNGVHEDSHDIGKCNDREVHDDGNPTPPQPPATPTTTTTQAISNNSSTPSEILVPTPNHSNSSNNGVSNRRLYLDETDQQEGVRLFLNENNDTDNDNDNNNNILENKNKNQPMVQDIDTATALLSSAVALALSSSSFRTNQYWIHKVLSYWFASHSTPEQAQRHLWMIPAQSPHRAKVDQEIFEQFGELLVQLAWNDHDRFIDWTGCPVTVLEQMSLGGESSTRHGSHMSSSLNYEDHEDNDNDNEDLNATTHNDLYGFHGKLAAIIVLDQFSRHIRRHIQHQEEKYTTPIKNNAKKQQQQQQHHHHHHHHQRLIDLPEQSVLDDLAYETAQLLVSRHAAEIRSGMLPTPMHVFAMMPFRHNNTIESVQYVQDQIQHMDQLVLQDYYAMVRRFRKATNRRLAVLQDEERRVGGCCLEDGVGRDDTTDSVQVQDPHHRHHNNNNNNNKMLFTDEDILECIAFDSGPACMSTSRMHPIHQTICSFLQARGIYPICKSKANTPMRKRSSSAINSTQSPNITTTQKVPAPIVVSLSGGVDSMVILSALAYLSRECNYHLYIAVVHIDYGNRPESAAEADFLRRYCRDILGNKRQEEDEEAKEGLNTMPASSYVFLCRRIDEVTRGVTARDEYEKITRRVRYDMYRLAVEQAREITGRVASSSGNDDEVGVILGHHRGDLRENVLSNAHRGCGPLDLSGMTAVSQNDGVTLYRPLLPLEKTAVYDYAHKYGVPYFKDTTPHWSTRGKLRNKLLPLLEEIYGEGSMTNLSNLAVESDACRDLLHSIAFGPFQDQVNRKPMGITFLTAPWKHYDLYFWKLILRETLHSAGLGMFSDKSVVSFLERVQAPKVREGWLQCRKDFATYLRQDGHVSIFYPSSFPWGSSDYYENCAGQTVDFGPENAAQVGPWRVTACIHGDVMSDERETEYLLALKAVPSVESLLDGHVEYCIKSRTWETADGAFTPKPLIFTCFTKATRPLAWKNVDTKLQQKLPLLGCDPASLAALKDPFGCGAVHLNAQGDYVENPVVLVKISLQLQELPDQL